MNDRIELHNESGYSEDLSCLYSGDIAEAAKRYGCTAVAVTDLNSVYAYGKAETALSQRNISMIYGITVSCVDAEDRYHVILLAKNLAGRDNIFRLAELLHENYLLLGHAVTREQLDAHRDGILMGAAAHDGQLVRAVQHRRNQQYLDTIAKSYDYIEFVPEPYDISAEVFQLAQKHGIPLCAVQYAVLNAENDPGEYHAYCALSNYYLSDAKPAYWKPAAELEEEIKTLYVLPHERSVAQQAIYDAPQKIAKQIETMLPIESILTDGQDQWHEESMPKLRQAVEATLRQRFGANCPVDICERIETELELIDQYRAAPLFLYLSLLRGVQITGMVNGVAANSEILHLWGLSVPDPMPRHIWCHKCGHWESVDLNIGTKMKCPGCGKVVVVSGMDLPVEALRSVIMGRGDFHVRCSEKTLKLLQSKFREFVSATILQVQLCITDETNSEAIAIDGKIVKDYLLTHPEARDIMRENENFWARVVRRKARGDEVGPPYYWLFCPGNNHKLLSHLPTYQIDQNIYRLLIRYNYWDTVPSITTGVSHRGFDLLEAYEAATGINMEHIPIYEPEIYARIRTAINAETEGDLLTEQACKFFRVIGPVEDGASYDKMFWNILKVMPLRCYEDLCRIFGILHGTGVWFGNAKDLLEQETVLPAQVIACREDVMDYLICRGCPREMAFEIMEDVRKGKAKWRKSRGEPFLPQQWNALQACGAEEWFIQSCIKIGYLFPRGYAAAMADGLAKLIWYVIHVPEEAEKVFAPMRKEDDDHLASIETMESIMNGLFTGSDDR